MVGLVVGRVGTLVVFALGFAFVGRIDGGGEGLVLGFTVGTVSALLALLLSNENRRLNKFGRVTLPKPVVGSHPKHRRFSMSSFCMWMLKVVCVHVVYVER